MKRESIFGRSAGAAVIDGFIHGRGNQHEPPQHRFGSGSAPAETRRRRHQQDRVQDTATYNCSCGFVFEAAVDTTVGCPHCGAGQAW